MRTRAIPSVEMGNIMRASEDYGSKVYTAAFICTAGKNVIVFDALVRVKPKLGELLNRSSPSGVMEIPSYIPEDVKSFTFTGYAKAGDHL